MKKFYLLLSIISVMLMFSCQQEDMDDSNLFEKQSSETPQTKSSFLSDYEESIPIYCYKNNNSHLYTKTPPRNNVTGTVMNINGKAYEYQSQPFNLPNMNNKFTRSLYLNNSGTLGYYYPWFQPGAVKLKEFYSARNNDYRYETSNSEIENLQAFMGDYKFIRNVGWVYPGSQNDLKKQQEFFVLKNLGLKRSTNYSPFQAYTATLTVTTISNGRSTTENITISFSGRCGEEKKIALPKGALVSVNMIIRYGSSSLSVKNINDVFDERIMTRNNSLYGATVYQATYDLDYAGRFDIYFW